MKRSKRAHPCFQESACDTAGRVHLPIAPKCNTACNFCNRRFDCPNESRPGVTSRLLSPGRVDSYLREISSRVPISVVGIAGPGDPLANPEELFASLDAVRRSLPEASLCVSTNGLALPEYAERLLEAGVDYLTVTVNAITPETGARIYRWVRSGKKILRGEAGAALMIENQLAGTRMMKAGGATLKINTVLIPGGNDLQIEEIAEAARLSGADMMNILPMVPVAGTPFGDLSTPPAEEVARRRLTAGLHLKQITHCRRCRADAAGSLGAGLPQEEVARILTRAAGGDRPRRIALASREGVLVNQHVGEAAEFLIFDLHGDHPQLLERREAPAPGCGDVRWKSLAQLLSDCRYLAATGIGDRPRQVLIQSGLTPLLLSGTVNEIAGILLRDEDYSHLAIRSSGCSGGGENCA